MNRTQKEQNRGERILWIVLATTAVLGAVAAAAYFIQRCREKKWASQNRYDPDFIDSTSEFSFDDDEDDVLAF